MTGNSDDLKLVSVEVMKAELPGMCIMDGNGKNMDGTHLRHSTPGKRGLVQDPGPWGWEREVGASVHLEARTRLFLMCLEQPTSLRAGPVPGMSVNVGEMKGRFQGVQLNWVPVTTSGKYYLRRSILQVTERKIERSPVTTEPNIRGLHFLSKLTHREGGWARAWLPPTLSALTLTLKGPGRDRCRGDAVTCCR